jgi:hypothetical protein
VSLLLNGEIPVFFSSPIVAYSPINAMPLPLILENYLGHIKNLFGDTGSIYYDACIDYSAKTLCFGR